MNLARFPRRRYADGPTPLQPMSRLSKLLGGPDLYIKRDDLLGFASGGNKVRKLEFVMADALAAGADTVITCGAVQSNHCRLTLAAAVREGLKCGLVLEERVPGSYKPQASGNNFLYHLMGVDRVKVVPGGSDMPGAMNALADEVRAQGGRPYIIPGGASNPLGALGYAACAQEILSQSFELGLRIDRVVSASGSAGTHAGLLAGLWGTRSRIPVVGMNVSRKKAQQEELVFKLAKETAALAGIDGELPRDAVLCFDDYVGPGYSLPTAGMVEAVKMLARTEAILLDPVYTGKAMAGMIDQVRKGFFQKGENVLFVHTGGSPALYAYMESFWEA
jgi:D-cysteine desulfhydrase